MSCIKYVLNTPISQIKQDWCEYKSLKTQLKIAGNDMVSAYDELTLVCDIDDELLSHNTCLEKRMILNRQGVNKSNVPVFIQSRCVNFVPEHNEKRCDCMGCECWGRNVEYYDRKKHFQEIQQKVNGFWNKKFENVK